MLQTLFFVNQVKNIESMLYIVLFVLVINKSSKERRLRIAKPHHALIKSGKVNEIRAAALPLHTSILLLHALFQKVKVIESVVRCESCSDVVSL